MEPARQIRKIITLNQVNVVVAFDIFSFFYIWYALYKIQVRPKVYISIHNVRYRNYKHFFQNLTLARFLSGEEKIHLSL